MPTKKDDDRHNNGQNDEELEQAAELKSATAGQGRYSLDFSHYEPVPPNVQQKLADAYKPRHDEE